MDDNARPDRQILQQFWLLSDRNQSVRQNAVCTLLQQLEKSDSNAKCGDNTTTLNYCLTRLLKGLASCRQASRQGFAAALTMLLDQHHSRSNIDFLFDHIRKNLPLSGDELINNCIARIFAYSALIESSVFNIIDNNFEYIKSICEDLLLIRSKKASFELLCFECFVQISVKFEKKMFQSSVWPVLKAGGLIELDFQSVNSNQLWLILELKRRARKRMLADSSLSTTIFNGKRNFFDRDQFDFDRLYSIICQSTQFVAVDVEHPLLRSISAVAIDSSTSHFQSFCKLIVCKLCESDSNRLILIGLQIVSNLLLLVREESHIVGIISEHFITALFKIVHSKHYQSMPRMQTTIANLCDCLRQIVIKFAADLQQPDIPMTIVTQFYRYASNFDFISKFGLSKSIISNLRSAESISAYLNLCIATFCDPSRSRNFTIYCAMIKDVEFLYKFATAKKLSGGGDRLKILKFFTLITFYNKNASAQNDGRSIAINGINVNLEQITKNAKFDLLKVVAKSALNRSLESMCHVSLKPGHVRIQLYSSNLSIIFEYLKWIEKLSDNKSTNLAFLIFDVDSRLAFKNLLTKLNKIVPKQLRKVKEKVAAAAKEDLNQELCGKNGAFTVILLYCALWMIDNHHEFANLASELIACHEHSSLEQTDNKKSDLSWIDGLIDIILGILSKNYHHLRVPIHVCLYYLSDLLTFDNLQPLLTIIGSRSEEDVLQEEPSGDEEASGDDDDVEEGDDAKDDEDVDSFDDDDDESSASEAVVDDDDDVDKNHSSTLKLKSAVKAALGEAADNLSDEEGVEEEDFDDDLMMTLDGKLSEVFKQHLYGQRLGKRQSHQQLNEFKFKCLDLIDILSHSSSISLNLICDLLFSLLKIQIGLSKSGENDRAVYLKINELIKIILKNWKLELQKKKNHQLILEIDQKKVVGVVEKLFELSERIVNPIVIESASETMAFLVKILQSVSFGDDFVEKPALLDAFRLVFDRFLHDRSCRVHLHLFAIAFERNSQLFLPHFLPLIADFLCKNSDQLRIVRKSDACALARRLLVAFSDSLSSSASNLEINQQHKSVLKKFATKFYQFMTDSDQLVIFAVEKFKTRFFAEVYSTLRILASLLNNKTILSSKKQKCGGGRICSQEFIERYVDQLADNATWSKEPYRKAGALLISFCGCRRRRHRQTPAKIMSEISRNLMESGENVKIDDVGNEPKAKKAKH